jgi:hypothetical protein
MSSIRADIELNAAPFIGGIAKVQRQIRNLQATAAGITAAFLAARAAIAGLSGVFNEMRGALDLGGQLDDLSVSTGASISELVVLRQVLANAGMGAEAAGPMIARFQRALAGVNEDGVTTSGVLEELGVNTLALSRMSLQDQFTELSRVIAGIEDPADRAAAAMKLFGRSGVEMLVFMRDPAAFTQAAQQVGELGNVLQSNAKRFDTVADAIDHIALKIDQFFVGLMSEMSGIEVFERISDADFTSLGQSAGQAASAVIELVGSLRSLLPVFVGVGAAILAFKLGIGQSVVTAASQFPAAMAAMAASMASPRVALVALGTAARATFTGMVAAARAASAGIKAALVSTGIGLAVVAAGELLAYAMGERDRVNQAARGEKSIVSETERMANRYGTNAQAISSPEDQSAVIDSVSQEIEAARERISSLEESFPDLGAEELAQFETRLRERIVMLEAIKDMAANISPEIMAANAEEKRRGEALAESKRRAEELARELERALESRDKRGEQAALDAMTPEQAASSVLGKASMDNAAQSEFVLNTSGLETLDQARQQLEAMAQATNAEVRLSAVGLPAAEGMLKMLDVAEGKTLALALEATGLPDAQALSAAIDAADDKTIALALSATGLSSIGELRAALEGISNRTVQLALEATGAESVAQLREMLESAPDRKSVDILLRALGTDSLEEARSKIEAMSSGGADITFDAGALIAEIERLKSLGTEATNAEKQRLFELLSIEEQLLAVQKRQADEDTKRAEQQERLADLRSDMLLDAEQIAAEASGDTERVREIETDRRAAAVAKQFEEQGEDPVTAAELGRKQAELEQLRREASGQDRAPVQVADAARQVGLGGRFFGEDRKPQEEMVRKQAESNRLLAEIRSLLASQPRQLLAETFD